MTQDELIELLNMLYSNDPKQKAWARKMLRQMLEDEKRKKEPNENKTP